ncbi:hypothetical protein Syun_001646 [Stephania yunnanensis]|uniref:PurT/PurK-like preATP-grasp domain-containing protein n=1 Tax=Stephania yunnanensis TaxID=152371 RepID=A0AAP0LEA5_9MAGN
MIVLDLLVNCPASALSHHHVLGSFDDDAAVQDFTKRCGVLTIEIEHVDVATIEELEQKGIICQPKASTIQIIQVDSIPTVIGVTRDPLIVSPSTCLHYWPPNPPRVARIAHLVIKLATRRPLFRPILLAMKVTLSPSTIVLLLGHVRKEPKFVEPLSFEGES